MEIVPTETKPKLVFWSTRDSIYNDIPSVTAIAETFLAVLIYWWLAISFETYLPLLISAAVAPLVLLRSDKSVILGVKWFAAWENKSAKVARSFKDFSLGERKRIIIIAIFALSASILFAHYLSIRFLAGVESWWAFPRGIAMGLICGALTGLIVFAGDVAVNGPGTDAGGSLAGALADLNATAKARALGFVRTRGRAEFVERLLGRIKSGQSIPIAALEEVNTIGGVRASIYAMVTFIALTITISFASVVGGAKAGAGAALGGIVYTTAPSFLGIAIGAFIVAIAIRVSATMRHVWFGLQALPRNFLRLALCTSPRQEPELIPGLSRNDTAFALTNVLHRFNMKRVSGDRRERRVALIFYPPAMLLWFIPAWLYRVTLKSTAWFWWPLAYLGGELHHARRPELFRQKIMETLWAKTTLVLAVATIITFILTTWFFDGVGTQSNPFLTVVGFLFLVDFTIRPWQLLAVASAALSVSILFWIDGVSRDYRYAVETDDHELIEKTKIKFGHVERVERVRTLFVIIFWLVVGAHTILYFNSLKCWFQVPVNIERWAKSVYGDRLPPNYCIFNKKSEALLIFSRELD